MAVRAVQEIPSPPLADSRDLGQLVADAGRDQNPPRPQYRAAGEAHGEPGFDPDHLILDELHAVAGHLGSSRSQEIGRRHPVARQKPLHVSRWSVPWRSGVDHRDPATCPAEHERCAQAGRAAANHHHVIVGHRHTPSVPERPVFDNCEPLDRSLAEQDRAL